MSDPDEAAAFLRDYEDVRGQPFAGRECLAAAGAAAWILAFNARWQAALIVHGRCEDDTIALVRDHREEYLALSWR